MVLHFMLFPCLRPCHHGVWSSAARDMSLPVMAATLHTVAFLRILHQGVDHVNRLIHNGWREVTCNIRGFAHPLEHLQDWRIAHHPAF